MKFPLMLCMTVLPMAAQPVAVRFPNNPLITLKSSATLGDNINGPSVIRVPSWIKNPLGRYYLYFAHHKGAFIRLAYANELAGPWKIYESGVLKVKDTAFYRPQPDPPALASILLYTHVASPEVVVDEANKRLIMLVHGWFTGGKRWPEDPKEAARWVLDNKYGQHTQTTISADGLDFTALPGISLPTSYSRLFRYQDSWYSMSRLGVLARGSNPATSFSEGPNPFDGSAWAKRVRHVATLVRGDKLYIFFSAIGDAPERILLSTISLASDWNTWRASPPVEVLRPAAAYECTAIPVTPSARGESNGAEHALRDPGLIEDNGRVILFYSYCGEQGLAAADVTSFVQ